MMETTQTEVVPKTSTYVVTNYCHELKENDWIHACSNEICSGCVGLVSGEVSSQELTGEEYIGFGCLPLLPQQTVPNMFTSKTDE